MSCADGSCAIPRIEHAQLVAKAEARLARLEEYHPNYRDALIFPKGRPTLNDLTPCELRGLNEILYEDLMNAIPAHEAEV